MAAVALLAGLASPAARAQTGGWGTWSTGNITDKNQTRTCDAGAGNTCTNAYGGGTTNHGGTETRPSQTFWNNYLLNGPAGYTNATFREADGQDITGVTLVRENDGRLQLATYNIPGGTVFARAHITTGQATPSSGTLFSSISLKSGLSRPNLTTWATIPGPGMVYYRPSANNAVVLVDSLCTASGDLRVRSGQTSDTEQTVQAGSSLCNLGASAPTKQAIGALSASDDYLYAAMPATLGAIRDSTPNTPARVGDVLTAGALSHPDLTVNTRARQWQRCPTQDCSNATDISPGGTAATYTVQAADHGHWLRVRVTQGGDFNDTLFSNILRVDRRGAIGPITGNARAGDTLTAGAVTDPDASPNTDVGTITHEWQTATASTGPFSAAPGTNNTATYTIASDQSQIGVWLRVMASYPNAGGALTSDPVGPVPGVRVSPTALNVTEGSSAGYRLVLGSRPTHAVTISVSSNNAAVTATSSLIFSTINWNAAQTVTVTGAADANATSERGVQLTHAVTSGDALYAGLTPPPVTVDVADSAASVIVSTTTLAVNEGGTGEYTLRLNTSPTHAVTISVSSNNSAVTATASLTFTRNNWNQAQTVTVTGAEDNNRTSESGVRLTHALSSSDTRYAAVNPPAVTVNVTDNDAPGVTMSTTTLAVLEGETGEYTLRLNNQPSHAVTISVTSDNTAVTVTSPLTFTTVNWNAAQTVTVTGAEDTNTTSESVQLSHALSSSDTGYAAVNPPAVTVSVRDNDAQGVVVSPPALALNEGGSGELTVRLAIEPTGLERIFISNTSVTLTPSTSSSPTDTVLEFTMTNWDAPQTLTVTAVEDDDADDETVRLLFESFNFAAPRPVVITITDNDTVGITLSSTALTVTEGRTATYNIRLGTRPSATVSILPQTFNADVATVSPATPSSLDFTTDNWNMPQTVTVMGVDDPDTNHESVQLAHAVRSSDATYAALTPPSVTVGVTDNDTPGVTVSPNVLAVNEGETGEYRLSLSTLPTAPVTIAVSNPDASAVTLSATSLTFTTDNWNSVQTVTVSGVEDADVDHETVQLTHTATSTDADYASGVTIDSVAVTLNDNDTPGVTVSTTTLTVNERGGTGMYTLRLNTRPMAAVTISVTHSNAAAATVSPTSLMFSTTDWNTAKTVTVTGVEDADTDDETVRLTHTATSTDPGYEGAAVTISAVAVTVDDETAGVTVSPTTLAVGEAGSGTYTLMLTKRPTVPVTIMVSNPDTTAVTLSATSLTFTTDNWNSVQTVTVSGVEDADVDHETVQLTHTATSTDADYASGVTIDPVVVTLNDNDTPGVAVSSTTLTVHERGGTDMYTLRLNTPPTEAVTISVTHSNAAAATVSPTSLMFGTTDWNTAKTITVTGVEDADTDDETVQLTHTVTSTDTNYRTVTAATVTVTVTETAAVSLDVDGSGGDPNQSDGLLLGRYLFGIRDAAGLLDTIPGSPSFNAVTTNIAGAFASGRLDVDGSGGDPNQSDGLLLGRYLFGIRDTVGLLDTIPGNPSFNAVRTNIEALLQ